MSDQNAWNRIVAHARSLRQPFEAGWTEAGAPSLLSLDDLFREGARRWPNTILEFHSSQRPATVTLAEVLELADRTAMSFLALGLRPGDVVVVQLPHWVEGLAVYMAAMRIGVVVSPLIHIYGPAELAYVLRKTRARAVVTPTTWRNIDFVDRLSRIGDQPDLEHIIMVGEGAAPTAALGWEEFLAKGASGIPTAAATPDAISTVLFTSGTTSNPKGVLHTHRSLVAETVLYDSHVRGGPYEPSLCIFPQGHVAGMLYMFRPFIAGETQVYMDQFDADAAVALIEKYKLAYTSGAPFHANALLKASKETGLSSLRFAITGAANVPPSLIEQWDALGTRLARCYGATEHPTISSGTPFDSMEKRATTDGRPVKGTNVRLVDDDGQEVRPGEQGEILTMGPELMLGYIEEMDNANAFTADGYFRTGDIGILDDQGYLKIVDRKKDIVVRGGEKISSSEVENILRKHPAILEVAVVGMPDETYGERVAAFVNLREGQTFDVSEAQAHFLTAGVAKQKTPEFVLQIDEFPRTPLGKIKKQELKQELKGMRLENIERAKIR